MVKNYLTSNYSPADSLVDATVTMSTLQLYVKLQQVFPSDEYLPITVAGWMQDLGFGMAEIRTLEPEWLLKKKKHAETTEVST